MKPKVCVSIIPGTVNEAIRLMEMAGKHKPDFIEVRMDLLENNAELGDIVGCVNIPLIATVRAKNCRGKFSGSEIQRRFLLLRAAEKGFEYVDVELSINGLYEIVKELQQIGAKPIISHHDFEKTPSMPELQGTVESQVKSGAEVCKIVTTAKALEDNLTLLNFLYIASKRLKVVAFAMGSLGKVSRVLSPLFGGYFTIASLKRGMETAPGQITVKELRTIYRVLGVG